MPRITSEPDLVTLGGGESRAPSAPPRRPAAVRRPVLEPATVEARPPPPPIGTPSDGPPAATAAAEPTLRSASSADSLFSRFVPAALSLDSFWFHRQAVESPVPAAEGAAINRQAGEAEATTSAPGVVRGEGYALSGLDDLSESSSEDELPDGR